MVSKAGWRNREYQNRIISLIKPGVELIFFDTETTGLSAQNDRIIEIGALRCRVRDDYLLDVLDELHTYINPGFMLSAKIVELTGITSEFLSAYPFEEDSFEAIHRFFGDGPLIVGGHNVKFDVRFLESLYERNGCSFASPCIEVDTLEMARDIFCNGEVKNHKLGTLASYCGIDDGVQFHSAIDDIRVTWKLFQLLFLEYVRRAEEEAVAPVATHQPQVISVKFWEGYRGFSRIYVDTSAGSMYYDVRRKTWFQKDVSLDTIDLKHVERECMRLTNTADLDEFGKFKDRVYA